jgi:DNA-binding transcriptional LysR family regulator
MSREGELMELSDINILIEVAKTGNISHAAKQLNYSQSNITARIKKLEKEYNVQLFNRYPKGVILTSKGEQFVDYALKIRNLLDDLEKEMQDTGEPSGNLKIGIVETAASSRFINILNEYQFMYPEVSISLINATSTKLLKKVQDHEIDGAFISGDFNESGLKVDYQMEDTVHLISKQTESPPESLCKVSWVVFPEGCPYRAITEEFLKEEDLSAKNVIEVSTIDNLLSCVKLGIAFTIMPKTVIQEEVGEFSIYNLSSRFTETTTKFVRCNDVYVTKAYDKFIELLNEKSINF